jgi:septal ring factor EnvC (AmiA/AmiB activator)
MSQESTAGRGPTCRQVWLRGTIVILSTLGWFGLAGAAASELDEVMDASARRIELAQASQQTINQIVDQTEGLEAEYKQIVKQLDGLKVYNDYMERQITNQESELADLNESIEQIGTVERQIMPLMIRMLEGLERFIELDMPFLREERLTRVDRLKTLMERADVTVAEKFRRLTEAFQIENDFGRTIETYKDTLTIGGATLEVNVLRLGRIGLYYQTNDASATGLWDRDSKEWTSLSGAGPRNQVREGIRMARKLVAPDLLMLEIPASEVAP